MDAAVLKNNIGASSRHIVDNTQRAKSQKPCPLRPKSTNINTSNYTHTNISTRDSKLSNDEAASKQKHWYVVENDEDLYTWQLTWREVISRSVIYLDGSSGTATPTVGRDKTRSQLKLSCFKFHSKVVDFFNADEVTIIMTRRPYDKNAKYPSSDIFHHGDKLRIWSFEKALRFFSKLSKPVDLSENAMKRAKKNRTPIKYDDLKPNEAKRFKQLDSELKLKKKTSHDKIMFTPGNAHSNNRMSLINNLRKTSNGPSVMPSQRDQQKLNYQQQVLNLLSYQKAQQHNNHQYQNPLYQKNMTYKKVYQSHYQRSNNYKTSDKLATLLTKEKLHGPTDRDPNVKTHNFHYFESPFVFVYDLRQTYRPLITSEWAIKNYPNLLAQAPWPKFYPSVDGRSPFLPDDVNTDHPAIRMKRLKYFDSRKKYRAQLKKMFVLKLCRRSSEEATDHDLLDEYNEYSSNNTSSELPKTPRKNKLLARAITGSAKNKQQNLLINSSRKRSFCEMNASGITQSNSQSAASQSVAGGSSKTLKVNNGLGPTHSHVASKEFKSLKRRIYDKDLEKFPTIEEIKPDQHDEENKENIVPGLIDANINNAANHNITECLPHTKKVEDKKINKSTADCTADNMTVKGTITGAAVAPGNVPETTKSQTKPAKDYLNKKPKHHSSEVVRCGYCENCRIRYDSFEEHIKSAKHRDFAKNDKNFAKIDQFIDLLHLSMGIEV